ncbi:33924_t:CDS:2 [Gigaspora margarita]|uniref:33924_t:CDS:1 n=1 Tax=Gigaspora margarita TaxID=4874 RepID=A0ABN7WFI7_GIGMA|nr:33924_t:CDS:2 [Gigaspora margarita]
MILDFKGLSINIIIVYVAPTSLEVKKNIKEYLKKHLKDIETKKKAQRCVILEKKQIAQLLRRKRFADIFYESNSLGQPTWRRKEDMDLIRGSDHQAVFVQLETGLNLRKRSQAENQRVKRKRLEIDMENINEKN